MGRDDNRATGRAMVDIRGEVSVVALTTDYDANDYLGEALDGVHLWFSILLVAGWLLLGCSCKDIATGEHRSLDTLYDTT